MGSFHISPYPSSSRVNNNRDDFRSELFVTYGPALQSQGIGTTWSCSPCFLTHFHLPVDVGAGNNVDPSAKIWSLYVSEADPYDKALVERWKGSMDGILIFVRKSFVAHLP
jgi:Family of unknown function (DUF6535)